MTTVDDSSPQSPAQWAVRWHGLVLAAVLVGSAPMVHVAWHAVLGHSEPMVPTRSQTPAPEGTWATLRDGSWMLAEERHLREASAVVWWLRGTWNENLLRVGLQPSGTVHVGDDGWLFLQAERQPATGLFERRAVVRRAALAAVRDRLRGVGVELVVLVIPDKSRVHPEAAFAGPAVGVGKAPHYGALLGDLASAGIFAPDLAAAMMAARQASPEPLYYRTDTHWRPQGALAAALATAASVEASPLRDRLPPRSPLRVGPGATYRGVGDLAATLGIGTVDRDFDGRRIAEPASLFAQRYVESLEFYAAEPLTPDPALRLDGKDEQCPLVLVGTSYAESNGHQALQLAFGRPIRLVMAQGAGGIAPMQRLLTELTDPARPRPRLVFWEIVERGFFEAGWDRPPF